jgi:hypothetical protein
MSKRMTALVIILGVLLACVAGWVGRSKACESHDPQGNLKGTALLCTR